MDGIALKTSDPNTIEPGQMRFLDNYMPHLPAARYQVAVTQTLKASTESDPAAVNVAQTRVQEFYVDGPRFALSPQEIHRQFPPPNAQGVFESSLPQIVLSHRGLPWERQIWEDAPETPWLALIVLDADEIAPPESGSAVGAKVPGTGATTIPASDLFAAPPSGVLLPDILPTPYQDPQQQVQVVDLTPAGFATAVPNQTSASLLASVREVDLSHKGAGGAQDVTARAPEPGMPNWARWYSVVSAARFPAAPSDLQESQTQVVHLVSLEGFTDYLRTENPIQLPSGVDRIRMVSLCSWAFASLPQTGQNFEQLMTGLAPAEGETLDFALPQKTPGAEIDAQVATLAKDAITAGFVPRSYRTRQGEASYGWYRGPFVPQLPAPLPALAQSPRNSAQLAVYDPATGLFDMSYATAFETGRMLALSSGSFTRALMRWQRRGLRRLSAVVETAAQADLDLAQSTPAILDALTRPPKRAASVMQSLAEGGLETLNAAFSDPQVRTAPKVQASVPMPILTATDLASALALEPVKTWLRRWARTIDSPVVDYLAKLWFFETVPYSALVPDGALLPIESFRAFYVDRNWQQALIQGALSTGVTSSREQAFQQVLRSTLLEQIETHALEHRNRLLGRLGAEVDTGLQMSGCLLRSAAVSGWPGLEIRAFQGGATTPLKADQRAPALAGTVPLPPARLTRLGPQVMLGVFNGVADWIEIDEPREGLHFGVDPGNKVYLRNLSGAETGQEIGADSFVTATIDTATRVLDLTDLVGKLQTALGVEGFGPADFALEMIQVPESMVFTISRAGSGGEAT